MAHHGGVGGIAGVGNEAISEAWWAGKAGDWVELSLSFLSPAHDNVHFFSRVSLA